MMIGMGLFWVLVIVGIIWLAHDGATFRRLPPEETALTILERRFAEGSLSLDDYQRRREVLTGLAAPRHDPTVPSDERERR